MDHMMHLFAILVTGQAVRMHSFPQPGSTAAHTRQHDPRVGVCRPVFQPQVMRDIVHDDFNQALFFSA
jgi:hypothetical protein